MRSSRSRKLSLGLSAAAIVLLTVFLTAPRASAQTEKVLHSFGSNSQAGKFVESNLVFDSAGNLYGTTFEGGTDNVGTVFELTPKPGGIWTEVLLHTFASNGRDGQSPVAGLILDSAGNLYGATTVGGIGGGGVVFELSPPVPPSTRWIEKVLYNFLGYNKDGHLPRAGLLFDSAGNLYGTTEEGGDYGSGTVFELSPAADGRWTEAVLHSFDQKIGDGYNPTAGLILDSSGNLYGTTSQGGSTGGGIVFELTPFAGGAWGEAILYTFLGDAEDGAFPEGSLIWDSTGNLYGTTVTGGPIGGGTVYKLAQSPAGGWTETVLYFFHPAYSDTDGYSPIGNLVFDSSGNLYGTTSGGGIGECLGLDGACGIVYQLTPAVGPWTETVLHYFSENGTDGYTPLAGLVPGSGGNLYGTTGYGGPSREGTVFQIKR